MDVRATVQQYRVRPSGEITRANIGEINFTSNRLESSVSTDEIFPSEEWMLCGVAWPGSAVAAVGSSGV